jgi:hypothetical protein
MPRPRARHLLAALLPLALLSAPGASAAPTASVEDGSGVAVELLVPGGTALLELLASAPRTGGPAVLRARLTTSEGVRRLSGPLTGAALQVTPAGTVLRTRLGKLPLRVEWRPSPYAYAASFGNVEGDDAGTTGWTVAGQGSEARVTLGSADCSAGTSGVTGVASVYGDAQYGDPLAGGLGLPTKGLRCQAVPSSGPAIP